MIKYQEDVIANGRPITNYTVAVYAKGTLTLSSLYSDNAVTTKVNPFTVSDVNGHMEFYAADGRYDYKISGTGIEDRWVYDILLEDPAYGSSAVITGGTIDGAVIGQNDPRAVNATSLTLNSTPIKLVEKIRASLASAKQNPYTTAPLTAAPAWVISTVYPRAGYVVSNGGNLYELQTAGTSAGATGPTGTGAALITDNTCQWFYAGPVWAASALPSAPILTYAAPTGLTKSVPYNTSGAFFFSGGTPTVNISAYAFPVANISPTTGNANGTYNAFEPSISFYSDAPKICIQGTQPFYNDTGMSVEIDGQFVSPGVQSPLTTVNPGGLVIDWSGSRKIRRYRVILQANFFFTGVYVDSSSIVYPSYNQNRFRVVVNGDSLTAGANGIPYTGKSWTSQFAKLIGCDDIYNCAAGGTGFIANNSNLSTTFAQRLPDIIGFAPDVHIIAGAFNDQSYTSVARKAAILNYLQTFRASSSAQILVFGSTSGSLGASSLSAVEADLLSSVNTFNDPKTVFIPISTDTPSWIDGTGNVGATAGNGNADVYIQSGGNSPHYTQGGVNYVAQKYANAWANYWNGK